MKTWQSIVVFASLWLLAASSQWWQRAHDASYARRIFCEYEEPACGWISTVKSLNFLRGDYRVSVERAPYDQLNFTVNIFSGALIPWDSDKKKERILRGSSPTQ